MAATAPDPEGAAAFAGPEFAAEHVLVRRDGLCALNWSVGGMHCAACVWVLERLPSIDPGVRWSQVDLGRGCVSVVYDPARSSPVSQALAMSRLGYRVRPWLAQRLAAERQAERRDLLLRLAVAAASAMGAMQLSMNLWAGELAQDLDAGNRAAFAWGALLVAAPAVLWSAWPIHRAALAAMRGRRWNVDLAASLTISAATVASVILVAQGGNELYVDAAAMFTALLLAARVGFLTAQERVQRLAGLMDGLLPVSAVRCRGDVRETVPTTALVVGDLVEVTAGMRLPCDGLVRDTPALVDTAVLTGESRPERVLPGATAFAGCSALETLRLCATATGSATRVGGLLAAGRAQSPRRAADPTDRLVAVFMPLLGLAAILTAAFWGWHSGAAQALNQGLAVLVVGCPCAIGLAVPLVRAAWLGRAAVAGILVRDPGLAERLATIRAVVFDKTGTLSEGRMRVVDWTWREADPDLRGSLLSALLTVEADQRHPAAAAITAWIQAQGAVPGEVGSIAEVPGAGVRAEWNGAELRIGTPAFAAAPDCDGTVLWWNGAVRAVIRLADPLRSDARAAVAAARAQGWDVHLWSGDRPEAVAAAARELDIAADHAHGACTPEDKADRLTALQVRGPVLMVWDGVNDAAALAVADVAIALRGGLSAALDHCHVFVADARLGVGAVAALAADAVAARQRIRRLLGWAVGYNAVAVALAAGGAWGPVVCAVAMPLSSLLTAGFAVRGFPAHSRSL